MSVPNPDSTCASEAPAPPCEAAVLDASRWFAEEVQPHDAQLKSYLRGAFPHVRDVEDVVQESYFRVWKAKLAQPITSAKAYLFTVARHLALNVVRRNLRSPVTCDGNVAAAGAAEERPGVAEELSHQEKLELLTDALAELPARTRDILLLNKFDGITQAEIARRLGLSEKTIEYHIRRGMQLCTEYFSRRGHDFF